MNILIADDNASNLKLLQAILESEGHHVYCAGDGVQALAILDSHKIDAVISDILMPNMDGYRLCYEIRQSEKLRNVPFITYTATYTSPADVKLSMDVGADKYLRKPASSGELMAAIEEVVSVFHPRTTLPISAAEVLKEFSERLVDKIEEKNVVLHKRTEELRSTHDQLRHLLSHSPAVIYTLKIEGENFVPVVVSDNIQRLLGVAPEDATYEWWYRCLHPEDHDRVLNVLQNAVSHGGYSMEYRMRHQNGTYRWIEDNNRVVFDDNGQPIEMVGVWSDINDRKQTEEHLLHAQKMESLGSLAGGVAHDFNNLLTGILGFAELAQMKSGPDSPIRDDLEEIRKAAERAAGLTRQLLTFARKEMVEPKVVNLNDLTSGLENLIRQLLGENIELAMLFSSDLGNVKIDPSQFEQVVINLAVNARDAMQNGGRLLIETHNIALEEPQQSQHDVLEPGEYVVFSITDSGCGMTKETQSQVFDPFFTTKVKGKGTGLGLSTCYGVVRNSGGQIFLYSEVGKGTAFRIYLPRAEAKPLMATSKPTAESICGGETLLIVEDETSVRALAKAALNQMGYRVLEAADAKTALQLVANCEETIDLVITDVVMPGMSGRELAEVLATVRPEIKVLYMSGYTADAMVHQGVLTQDISFLQKPFTPQRLSNKVREVLDLDLAS